MNQMRQNIRMKAETDYYQTARENEEVFRNILKDLRDNRAKRPAGYYISEDLDAESKLEDIFQKYSEGERCGKFTISGFEREKNLAGIGFQNLASLSGGGAHLEYLINEDNSVEYKKALFIFIS